MPASSRACCCAFARISTKKPTAALPSANFCPIWRPTSEGGTLKAYKDGGFDRVNPSILKADILTTYPNFNERSIGFKRFSDIMKQLEKEGMLVVEMDEQKTMLIKLL